MRKAEGQLFAGYLKAGIGPARFHLVAEAEVHEVLLTRLDQLPVEADGE